MSATTQTPDTSNINMEDVAYGHKVIGYALQCLAWGTAVAVAFSCSTIIMGIIMFIIMSIVMALLAALMQVVIFFKAPTTSVAGIGRVVGGAAARVTSMFTRKVPA